MFGHNRSQLDRIEYQQLLILGMLITLNERNTLMEEAVAKLVADVAALTTVDTSAIALLHGLKVALDEAIAKNDPAALVALSASIETQTQALADAVVANTPAVS